MLSSTPERPPTTTSDAAEKTPTNAFRRSITALAALCTKKASQITNMLKFKPSHPSPRSPLALPKKTLKTISQSAMGFVQMKKTGRRDERPEAAEEEEWGHGGVWQRGILMGDKCQPLDYSGAIYYDSNGNKMNEPPLRSPRASPLPGYLLRKTQQ